jgi:hypothetical protein
MGVFSSKRSFRHIPSWKRSLCTFGIETKVMLMVWEHNLFFIFLRNKAWGNLSFKQGWFTFSAKNASMHDSWKQILCAISERMHYFNLIFPVFWLLLEHLLSVKRRISLCTRFIMFPRLGFLWGNISFFFFLSQQLIPFVPGNSCNCAGWRVVQLQHGVVHIQTMLNWKGTPAMPHNLHPF